MIQTENNIISTLTYFSCFNYPLTKDEIYTYLHFKTVPLSNFEIILEKLIQLHKIQKIDIYYGIVISQETIELRIKRNELSTIMLKKAIKIVKILRYFPFVLGISISGSLSKNCMDENSDIDYFIITAPNRVNTAQFFLRGFTKLFFSYKLRSTYFCFNYLIDKKNMYHKHQNLFTATEINCLIPLVNKSLFNEFKKQNNWIKTYFPNTNMDSYNYKKEPLHQPILSKIWIYLCNNFMGDWFEKKALQFFINKKQQVIKRDKIIFTKLESDINFINEQNELKLHYKNNETRILNFYDLYITKNKI